MSVSEVTAGRAECTYVGSTESGQVVASSHHDQSNGGAECHEGETLGTTPDVHNFTKRNVTSSRDGIGNNVDDTQQGVRIPVTCQVGNQVAQDGALEGIDKV
jgi:hypothetical protein